MFNLSNVDHNQSAALTRATVLEQLFGRSKPVIAMMHLLPLPGCPLYDSQGGMVAIVDALRRDLDTLCIG